MKRKRRYDLIIYTSLIIALICIGFSAVDYSHSSEESTIKETKKDKEVIENDKPNELDQLDPNPIIKTYLNKILDQIIKDEVISYQMIKTWGEYDIINSIYKKEVLANFYEYETNILIPNKDALLPKKINEELSTDEYNVVTLTINIIKNKDDTFSVKSINKAS